MRRYETLLHGLTGLKSLAVLRLDLVLSLAVVFVLYKHLKIEKITWRSYLLYALIFLNFVALAGLDLIFPGWHLPLLNVVMLIMTAVSTLIHLIYPIPSLPKLKQPLGTRTTHWSTTVEFFNIRGDKETQEREINARVWYPAETIEGYHKKSYYGPKERSEHVAWFYENITHFALTDVNARYDAPLSNMKAKYPVIIFTHGQESLPENHTFVLEKLASKGFFVFGLYHNDLNGKYPGPLSFRLMEIAQSVRTLVAMNTDETHWLHQRLDFTHGIGLHGHSLGGATSFFASTDFESLSRRYLSDLPVPLTCCSCSDPWMWIVLKDNYYVERPLLMIKSDHWLGREDDLDKIRHFSRVKLHAPVAVVTMKNTWHYNFGDMVFKLVSPLGLKVFPRSWRCEGNLTTPMLGEHGQRGVNTLNHVIQFVEEFHTHHLVNGSADPFQPSDVLMQSDTCSVELNMPKN